MTQSRDVGRPEAGGYYKLRLVRKGPWVAATILHIGGVWMSIIDGRPGPAYPDTQDGNCPGDAADVWRVWHGGRDIEKAEYEHMLRVAQWARKEMPAHSAAKPTEAVDLTELPSLF